MHEIKYFIEDHWIKLVIGLGLLGVIFFIFSGESEEQETAELNDTGMVTEENYETQAEDAEYAAEYEAELEEEEQQNGENIDSGEDNLGFGDGEQEQESGIQAEEVDYSEETEFELVGDLTELEDKYQGNDYNDMVEQFESDEEIEPEGDILRNKILYTELGTNVEGCMNNNTTYESCIGDILSELKWLSGDMTGELEKSYNIVGAALANQTVALEGMRESHSGGMDLENVYDALEIALYIRGSILKDLGSLEGMDESERGEVETRINTRLNELEELEKFVDNYWGQVMVTDSTEE